MMKVTSKGGPFFMRKSHKIVKYNCIFERHKNELETEQH